MTDPVEFSALLCSRLCHDLISPVGAFTNGLELLADEDDPDMRLQVIELLQQSAGLAAGRLQFFRLAFGAGGGFGETVAADIGRDAITAYLATSRVTLDWRPPLQQMSKDVLKAILNLVLLAAESLVRGGTVTVDGEILGGRVAINVKSAGDRPILNGENLDFLEGRGEAASLSAKTVPAYLAHQTISGIKGQITARHDEGAGAVYTSQLT